MAAGDAKIVLGTQAEINFGTGLESLATSATRVTGHESAALVQGTNYATAVDLKISGHIKVHNSSAPTANEVIALYAVPAIEDDGTTWPDVFDGTESAETVTSVQVRDGGLILLWSQYVTATANITYPIRTLSLMQKIGGFALPGRLSFWVTHSTGVDLSATAGASEVFYTPVYINIAQS